ncbi:hypothetical protein IG193_01080 [Infirmifilum lucidum]|uniref:DUF3267 domain-containing protein n=1 Tax=Infirmifilum lucidum TaxID=2776706 RepID=A0A7L9FH08_9CREN|nr:hypothetical protein [Infirmifilum lucidum]QOJ79090.1 hypothetical protein IG193_01080 [Infirmifilum lucidum]
MRLGEFLLGVGLRIALGFTVVIVPSLPLAWILGSWICSRDPLLFVGFFLFHMAVMAALAFLHELGHYVALRKRDIELDKSLWNIKILVKDGPVPPSASILAIALPLAFAVAVYLATGSPFVMAFGLIVAAFGVNDLVRTSGGGRYA